ncbi:MAG: hypothetical protein MPJ50_13755 [Pirellulales bacterium]|nr:hypothetical protein [Pirellulales bacterium]
MWRALFWAIGLYAVLLGSQFMLIDRAVLHDSARSAPSGGGGGFASFSAPAQEAFIPPEWAPWSLITFGVITLLYSFTIPKRIGE